MKIYVAFHKEFPLLTKESMYTPLHVGKALSDKNLGFIGDDTGENISFKNRYYSELTGLYWIWKNTTDEPVGLCHYRRYFFVKKPTWKMRFKKTGEFLIGHAARRHGVHYLSSPQAGKLILTENEANSLLREFDAIIPIKRKLRYSVYEQYRRKHHIEDLDLVRQIMQKLYPEYIETFDQCMQAREILHCNMFVMKRSLFDSYMHWLFNLLFELEERSDISSYTAYQQRLYGFISERLLDVWLTHNKVKYYSAPVLYFKKMK